MRMSFVFHMMLAKRLEMQFYYMPEFANEGNRNEYEIPDVPNEPCLLVCPHIIMLALLFANQAFAVSSLTSPKPTVPSSDCARAETSIGFSEGGDGKKIIVSAVQKQCEKRTSLRGGSFSLYHSQPANEHSRKHSWHGTSYESIYLPAGQWASS